MRFEEALKAMREGKTVKSRSNTLYRIEDDIVIRKEDGASIWYGGDCVFQVMSEDWEIVDE